MKKLLLILLFVPLVSFGQEYKVTRVIDGDTFEIEGGEKVRMIGINAPELSEKFGLEAKNYLKKLIENKRVRLIKGEQTKNKGFYQRLLRYVYLDREDINLKMIQEGYALAYLKYKFSKTSFYYQAELKSKESRLGLWNDYSKNFHGNFIKENKFFSKKGIILILVLVLLMTGIFYYKK